MKDYPTFVANIQLIDPPEIDMPEDYASKGYPKLYEICNIISQKQHCEKLCLEKGAKETQDECPNGDLKYTYCTLVRRLGEI